MSQLASLASQIGDSSGFPTAPRKRGVGESLLQALPFALAQFHSDPSTLTPILQSFQTTPEQEFEREQQVAALQQRLLRNKFNALLGVETHEAGKATQQGLADRHTSTQQGLATRHASTQQGLNERSKADRGSRESISAAKLSQSQAEAETKGKAAKNKNFQTLMKNLQDSLNEGRKRDVDQQKITISTIKLNQAEEEVRGKVKKSRLLTQANENLALELEKAGRPLDAMKARAGRPVTGDGISSGKAKEITRKKAIQWFRDNDKQIVEAQLQFPEWGEDIFNRIAESRFRLEEEEDPNVRATSIHVHNAYWGAIMATGLHPDDAREPGSRILKDQEIQKMFLSDVVKNLSSSYSLLDIEQQEELVASIVGSANDFTPAQVHRMLANLPEPTTPLGQAFGRVGQSVLSNPVIDKFSEIMSQRESSVDRNMKLTSETLTNLLNSLVGFEGEGKKEQETLGLKNDLFDGVK